MLFGFRNRIRRVKQRLIGFGTAVLVVGALAVPRPRLSRRHPADPAQRDGVHRGSSSACWRSCWSSSSTSSGTCAAWVPRTSSMLVGAGPRARASGGSTLTDMDTAAGEGLRRRRDGRARRPRATRCCRSSGRGRSRGCATRRPRSSRPTSSSRSTWRRCASCRRSAWTSSTPTRARSCAAAGAETDPDTQRVRFDPDMVTERDQDGARRRSRCTPGTPRTTSQLGGDWMAFGTVGSPPNVSDLDRGRRIGNREDYQNLLRLGQSLNAVHFLAGYPVEPVDLHHGVRHLHATLRRADADGQGDPLLQPRPPAQRRRARDGPHRPRRRRRDARPRAVGLHGRQLELAAPPRRADAPGDHGVRARATRSCASRRSRWPGRWRR